MKCPNCAHTWTTTKKTTTPAKPIEGMSVTELYAHYKKTAPLEDTRFFLRVCSLSPAVRRGAESLEAAIVNLSLPRADVYRQLYELQDRWRQENYWGLVVVPAARIERRRVKAAGRMADRKQMAA
jgi:hypothetical protein